MDFPFFIPRQEVDTGLDPVTGLPGLASLVEDLGLRSTTSGGRSKNWDESKGWDQDEGRQSADFLLLLEIYPQARDAQRGLIAIRRARDYLNSLFGQAKTFYALGLGIFALVWPESPPAEIQRLMDKLLGRLRREGFARAHVGLAQISGKDQQSAENLLRAAWQSLALARKRGPFGLCLAAGKQLFPPLATADQSRLNRLWRGRKSFALIHLRQDQVAERGDFSKLAQEVLAPALPVIFLNQREILVYLDGADETTARSWFADFRQQMYNSGANSFSGAIAIYPFLNFPKSQFPLNCRKALLHAELLGPDSLAVFNGVSLNISGDAYYNEGDLRRAVRDYNRGLVIDPVNVNLLNSLGVALVQLKRARSALRVFARALELEPNNFMTLTNLGFAHLSIACDKQAIDFFQRALKVNDCSGDLLLLLQLAKLYYQQRRYQQALELLHHWFAAPESEERRNTDLAAAHLLSGQILLAQRQYREAMVALEKSLALTPRDPEALSLLGELYLLNAQGDEIALSLCRQAVNLDDERGENWRRLGWVQWRLGRLDDATLALKRALSLDHRDYLAASHLGAIYQQQGRNHQAHRMRLRARRWQPAGQGTEDRGQRTEVRGQGTDTEN